MKVKRLAKAFVRQVSEATEGLLVAVIGSTDTVDRYGEVIDQSTWNLKHFKKNPVILWAHNLSLGEDRPPIGKATKVKVEDDKLMFDIQFDMADPFAADIFRKYKEGFLSAFSVGFIPHQIKRYEEDGKSVDNPILMDNELLELSAVPVPANPEALNALRARSFRAKTWDQMVKEAEKADEDGEKPPATEPKKDENTDNPAMVTPELTEEQQESIAEKTAAKLLPHIKTQISDTVKAAVKPNESVSGSDSEPGIPPQNGGDQKAAKSMVKTMRLATKMLQAALAQHNAAVKGT